MINIILTQHPSGYEPHAVSSILNIYLGK